MTTPSNKETLIGALELAMLDHVRQNYLSSGDLATVYVVDFPSLAQVQCIPPLNLSVAETTGFLETPARDEIDSSWKALPPSRKRGLIRALAKRHAAAVGLTEVLARFVFEQSWSGGGPKLMLESQILEAASIENVLRDGALVEWQQTTRNSNEAAVLFQDVLEKTKGKSLESFVEAVADSAETLLPAIYGEYSIVRQHLRFSDIKPTIFGAESGGDDASSRPVVFANMVLELKGPLDELQTNGERKKEWDHLFHRWLSAIPPTGASERRRRDDAETLATVEYLNVRMEALHIPLRVAFVTDVPKLFDAAVVRFGCVEAASRRFPGENVATGTARAFSKARYTSYLLSHGGDIQRLPLIDPRALLTDRAFVDFASGGTEASESSETVRSITEWLPFFFNGAERSADKLARSYRMLQGIEHTATDYITEADFSEGQYAAIQSHWKRYVTAVGTAHGLRRYSTRAHLVDLAISIVLKSSSNVADAVSRHLDSVLFQWLPAIGGATFKQMATHRPSRADIARSQLPTRSVPPIVMPSFARIQQSLMTLLGTETPARVRENAPAFAWFTDPTAENLGLATDWCESAPWRTSYIQALGISYGFAIEQNWSAAYRLSSAALRFAEAHRQSVNPESGADYFISGREAGFIANFSARRSISTRATMVGVDRICADLMKSLRRSVDVEAHSFAQNGWQVRSEAHELRYRSEQDAWDLLFILSARAGITAYGSVSRPTPASLNRLIERSSLAYSQCRQMVEKFADDLHPHNALATEFPPASVYRIALIYCARLSQFIILQLMLLSDRDQLVTGDTIDNEQILQALSRLEAVAPSDAKDCRTPWSRFEHNLLALACRRVSFSSQSMPSDPTDAAATGYRSENSLAYWRDARLNELWAELAPRQATM